MLFSHRLKTHVETVVQLRRENVDDYIAVDLDISMLDSNVGAHASYPEIKAYVLEHTGLKVSNLYIAQVKQKCGIIERENYNHGHGASRVPTCPQEKEAAILDALKYFGMI